MEKSFFYIFDSHIGGDGKFNVLSQFGIPNIYELKYIIGGTLEVPNRGTLWGDFKDGIGMITAVGKDEDTVAFSMIAENGRMWTYDQIHNLVSRAQSFAGHYLPALPILLR